MLDGRNTLAYIRRQMSSEFDPFWDEHGKNRRSELRWLDVGLSTIEDPFAAKVHLFKERLFEKAAILTTLLHAEDDAEGHYDLIRQVSDSTEQSDVLFGELIRHIMGEVGNENERFELLTGLYITTDNIHTPIIAELVDNNHPQIFVYNALKAVIQREYQQQAPPVFLDSLESRYYSFTNSALSELMAAYDYEDNL